MLREKFYPLLQLLGHLPFFEDKHVFMVWFTKIGGFFLFT